MNAAGDDGGNVQGDATPDTRWMTYRELADFLGVAEESGRRRAQRAHWPRRPGNDGKTRVGVPGDITPDETRTATRDGQGDNGGDITPTLAAWMERQAADLAKLHERVGRAEGEAIALREALAREGEQRERAEGERETLATEIIRQRERTAQAEGEAAAMREALAREARRAEETEVARQLAEIARQRAEALARGEQQRFEQARAGQQAASERVVALQIDVTAKTEALAREARQIEEAEAERQKAEAQRDAAQATRDATAAELAIWTAGGPLARAWRGFWRGR